MSLAASGPRGHWLKGNLAQFVDGRLGFLEENFRRHGDVFKIRLGPKPILVFSHRDAIEEILVTKNRSFIKHFALRNTRSTLGQGLLTSEGDFWRRQRKLAQPAFNRDQIARHATMMVDFTRRMLDTWADGQTRDAQDDMMRLTLEIVAKTLVRLRRDRRDERRGRAHAMDTVMMRNFNKNGSPSSSSLPELGSDSDESTPPAGEPLPQPRVRTRSSTGSSPSAESLGRRTGATCSRCSCTRKTRRAASA